MKKIYRIAKTELENLFFSPVAWLILIAFIVQTAIVFIDSFGGMVDQQDLGRGLGSVTFRGLAGYGGLFRVMQQYLYFYIPLLTMGLMSREYSSGSIKLLYSSPISNGQIILGKYLSMMAYALLMVGILFIFVLYEAFTVVHFDFPAALSGLLGLYLLICGYAAIGLFMSSLTSYQVVAAIGTLATLFLLNMIGGWWQDVEFVRDLTYWLSMKNRSEEFICGMICSDDLLYYLIVIALFLSLSIIRLKSVRQKSRAAVTWGKYLGVFVVAVMLGYVSSRPQFMGFYDATATKTRTLTKNSQDVLAGLEGSVKVTTFVNILDRHYYLALPRSVNQDLERFKQYRRFKPEIKMKYVYYYDKANNPGLDNTYPLLSDRERMTTLAKHYRIDSMIFKTPEQIRQIVDLEPEGNRLVKLIERENGQKTFLRVFDDMQVFPSESEITAAFKRIIMELPLVGFVQGHGERSLEIEGDRGYNRFAQDKPFRYALINQGFDIIDVNLTGDIPERVNILVIADVRTPFGDEEMARLDRYIERGGHLLIMGEIRRQEIMNPLVERFGVEFVQGRLVKPSEDYQADMIKAYPTKEAGQLAYQFDIMRSRSLVAAMPGVAGIEVVADKGYRVVPLFVTDSTGVWNEMETTDFVDDTVRLNPSAGEVEKIYATALALTRQVGGKEQKIMIFGDADCISNGELGRYRKNVPADNFSLITGSFFWMSDGEVPIDIRRPEAPDNAVKVTTAGFRKIKTIALFVFPALIALGAGIILLRRRGR